MLTGEIAEFVSAENRETHEEHFRNLGHNGLTVHELDLVVHNDLCGEVRRSRRHTPGSNMNLAVQAYYQLTVKFVRSFAGVGLDSASFCPLSLTAQIEMKLRMDFEEIASLHTPLSLSRRHLACVEVGNQEKEADLLAQLQQLVERCLV